MENELIKKLAEGQLILSNKYLELTEKYQEVKAENERLKGTVEHIRRCMFGWKSHLHPDLLTLKTIDKILIEHINH